MADTPAVLDKELLIKLSFEGHLPGESIVVAALDYAKTQRQTMDPEILKRLDDVNVWICEQFWSLFGYEAPKK